MIIPSVGWSSRLSCFSFKYLRDSNINYDHEWDYTVLSLTLLVSLARSLEREIFNNVNRVSINDKVDWLEYELRSQVAQ
jgi:hypothetical protein